VSFEETVESIVRRVVREELGKVKPAANSEAPTWLSPEEAAKRVSLSPDTVRSYCAGGKLPAKKVGGVWRIKASDLETFMERGDEPEALPDPREVALAFVNGKR
jgi:excisionase family DNA binding protein